MNNEYNRPQGFEKEKLDCTVRAFSLTSNLSYEKVHEVFKANGRKEGKRFFVDKVIKKICEELNLEIKLVKRSGTVSKFIKLFPKGNYYCIKRGHAFAVIDGVAHDLTRPHSIIRYAWLIKKKDFANSTSEEKK